MNKVLYYNYLGENGTLLTTIYLNGVYHVKKYMLAADEGKLLTKDGVHTTPSVLIPESEIELWYEVPSGQN